MDSEFSDFEESFNFFSETPSSSCLNSQSPSGSTNDEFTFIDDPNIFAKNFDLLKRKCQKILNSHYEKLEFLEEGNYQLNVFKYFFLNLNKIITFHNIFREDNNKKSLFSPSKIYNFLWKLSSAEVEIGKNHNYFVNIFFSLKH